MSSGFQTGLTQTRLYSYRRWLRLEIADLRRRGGYTFCMAKTKALISCAITAQLICTFVFAYAKSRFSHEAAHMYETEYSGIILFYLLVQH